MTNGILPRIQTCCDPQTRRTPGGTDELEDLLVAHQRLAGPVVGNAAEQSALNGIVFGGTRGVMSDGYGESVSVAQLLLELVLPGTACSGVAASRVRQDEHMLRLRIAAPSLLLPPTPNGVGGESGGFVETPTNMAPRLAWRS